MAAFHGAVAAYGASSDKDKQAPFPGPATGSRFLCRKPRRFWRAGGISRDARKMLPGTCKAPA